MSYIPNASQATVGYFGRNHGGNLRAYCVKCNDTQQLAEAARIYGDLYVASGPLETMAPEDECDECGVTFLSLSQACQAEHEAQQAEWSRQPITHVVEMGMVGDVRCRIY
jgi:hypothetical protein